MPNPIDRPGRALPYQTFPGQTLPAKRLRLRPDPRPGLASGLQDMPLSPAVPT